MFIGDADDWLGVVALEKEALALARELRGAEPGLAGKVHSILGLAFRNVGDYGRARELHEQAKAMAEALGERAGVVQAGGTGAGAGERADAVTARGRGTLSAAGGTAGTPTWHALQQ